MSELSSASENQDQVTPGRPARWGRWIQHWEPEDAEFWAGTGRAVATRNLIFSIFTEHIGFCVWSLWSVLVLFMGPRYGFSIADKFLLTSTPTLVGSVLRIPYNLAVARFGGRNWTIVSAVLLLIPTSACALVMQPGTSLGTFVAVAALAGFGGGNFASSMTNINAFYPGRRKGWALGLNAGGGNLGVAVVQLIGLAVLGTAGAEHPKLMLWVFIPLVVISAVCAVLFMDNLAGVRNDTHALRDAVRDKHSWVISVLYIGTFGSFIGYSFAFGLVLQNQFHRTPVQAAAVTFLGPLLGSLFRPIGGWLADRWGGAKVTFWDFAAMTLCAPLLIAATQAASLPLYTASFIALFLFSGIGNGSVYKMIPAVFHQQAVAAIAAGQPGPDAWGQARRMSGALIGIAGAVGGLGGVLINLAFRQSFASVHTGTPAVIGFVVFYAGCFALTWWVYLRRRTSAVGTDPLVAVRV
jgi:NNP family nitrate/nitrite transporter-like MFS transporter